jgi:hypothetical protein
MNNTLIWISPNRIWEIRRTDDGLVRAYRAGSKYPIYKSYMLPKYVGIQFDKANA